jgi:hypothetical protein
MFTKNLLFTIKQNYSEDVTYCVPWELHNDLLLEDVEENNN